MLFPRTL